MWKLQTGEDVVDRKVSHIHLGARELLPAALAQVEGGLDFIVQAVQFGRVIGQKACVATGPGDRIVFATRVGRAGPTRFVLGRKSEDCTTLTVVLKRREEGGYVLLTAFVGTPAGREPWDPLATAEDRDFWSSHALVWGSEPVVEGGAR